MRKISYLIIKTVCQGGIFMDDGNTKELDYKQLRNRMTCTDNNIQAYQGMADDSLDKTKK